MDEKTTATATATPGGGEALAAAGCPSALLAAWAEAEAAAGVAAQPGRPWPPLEAARAVALAALRAALAATPGACPQDAPWGEQCPRCGWRPSTWAPRPQGGCAAQAQRRVSPEGIAEAAKTAYWAGVSGGRRDSAIGQQLAGPGPSVAQWAAEADRAADAQGREAGPAIVVPPELPPALLRRWNAP